MAIANLRVPISGLPQVDQSWIGGIADTLGGGLTELSQRRSYGKLADLIQQPGQAPAQQPAGGLLSRLSGQQPSQAAQPTGAAPVMPVRRGQAQGSTYQPFINTVRAGGLTNPNALAAVAAYGDAESGWNPKNAVSTWSDPSQSGQPGTSGGILSWRGDRYSRLAAGGDLSPEAQARYFLQEDPQLIAALNQAKSPEEASRLMANAWKFAGYDKPGGEAARRSALARNYFANDFANEQPTSAAAAIEAQAPGGMGSPLTDQAFDDRFGPAPLPVDQIVGQEALAARLAETNAQPVAQPAAAEPVAAQPAAYAPNQVADASGAFMGVPGVQPIPRGGVNPEVIQFMLRDPNLRDAGLKLWAQNATGSTGDEWQFIQSANGDLLRANQQTGAIELVGNFARPQEEKAPQIVELFDEQTGQPYKARYNPQTMEYERVGGVKAPNGLSVTTNPDGTVSVTQGSQQPNPKLTEQQSKDLVYYRRGSGALTTLDSLDQELTSLWGAGTEKVPGGNYLQSSAYQKAKQAGKEFLQALLRKDTGAAITPQETTEYGSVYLPQPGDGPGVLLQKKEARSRALEAIRKGLGPAEILAGERPTEAQAKSGRVAPQAGAIEDGYRFRGGDPADPNNWEPAQ